MQSYTTYLSQEDFERVIDTIPTLHIRKWKDEDVEYLFRNQYEIALRPIEGIMLKKEDFNLMDRRVYLGKTKTNKADYGLIPRGYVEPLAHYLDAKPLGRLTPNLTYGTYIKWIQRLGKILEIPSWTQSQSETGEKTKGHIFRKSKGKDLLQTLGYQNIAAISAHLRHAKVSTTTDHYLNVKMEAAKELI